MNTVDACPAVSVVAFVTVNDCPVAPGGVAEMANDTLAASTGLPNVSLTVMTNGLASAERTVPLWLLPDVRAMVLAEAEVAVDVKVIGLFISPDEVAMTV